MPDTPQTFQDLILALQQYWGTRGCALLQPYDMEVGAGTFNPATFLRVLGPEPWRAAYVEPSRRPSSMHSRLCATAWARTAGSVCVRLPKA